MANFMPYIDKENTSQLGILSNIATSGLQFGPVGKTFQQNSQFDAIRKPQRQALKNVNTRDVTGPTGPTARKALGHLNVDPSGPQKGKQTANMLPGADCLKPPAPASKPQRRERVHSHQQSVETVGSRTEEELYPEIENYPQYEETDPANDSFSDVWAPEERADSYIQEILDWRPTRLYPIRDDKTDHDSLIDDDLDSSLNYYRVTDLTLEDPDIWESNEGYTVPPDLEPIEELDSFIMRIL